MEINLIGTGRNSSNNCVIIYNIRRMLVAETEIEGEKLILLNSV